MKAYPVEWFATPGDKPTVIERSLRRNTEKVFKRLRKKAPTILKRLREMGVL